MLTERPDRPTLPPPLDLNELGSVLGSIASEIKILSGSQLRVEGLDGPGHDPRLLRVRIANGSKSLVEGLGVRAAAEDLVEHTRSFLVIGVPKIPKDSGNYLAKLLFGIGAADFPVLLFGDDGVHAFIRHGDVRRLSGLKVPESFYEVKSPSISYSPAQRWLASALLQASLQGKGWWPEWVPRWESAVKLARAGSISLATATRGLNAFENEGWISRDRDGFHLVDPVAMMVSFADHARLGRQQGHLFKIAYGGPRDEGSGAILRWFFHRGEALDPLGGLIPSYGVTGWHALQQLGLGISTGIDDRTVQISVAKIQDGFARNFNLVPVADDPDIEIFETGFLPTVVSRNPWPCVDPFHAMLPICGDRRNGAQQIDAVMRALQNANQESESL